MCLCSLERQRRERRRKEERRERGSKSNGVFIVLKFVESLLLLTQSKYMAREPKGS